MEINDPFQHELITETITIIMKITMMLLKMMIAITMMIIAVVQGEQESYSRKRRYNEVHAVSESQVEVVVKGCHTRGCGRGAGNGCVPLAARREGREARGRQQ